MAGGASAAGANYFDGMTKLGKVHKHFLWIAAMCYFFDQMDMQLFNYIVPALTSDLGFTDGQIATMIQMNFVGMCLGGLIAGFIADRLGRKKSLLLFVFLFSAASLINAVSAHYWNFVVMRFLIGFGVIGMVVIAMVYMAEMLPSATRGKYQALTIACGTLGIPFGALFANVALATGEHGWRLVFLVGGAGIMLVPIGVKWLKESPRWLMSMGKQKDAERIVTECTNEPCDLSSLIASCVQAKRVGTVETLQLMFGKSLIKQTLVVMCLTWGVTLGIFYISNWAIKFLVDIGWVYSTLLIAAAIGVVGTPLGDVSVSFISDKGGRKTPIIIFMLLNFAVCITRGYVGEFMVGSMIPYIITGVLTSALSSGAMTMLWTYLAESYPTRIRSNSTGLVFASARFIAAVATGTVPAVYAAVGYFGINVVNGLMFLIPAIIAMIFGRASAQKSLEELEAEYELGSC